MVTYFESSLNQISVHKVGNKMQDEYFTLSDHPLRINDELLQNLLMQYFLKPFEKVNEVFRLIHSTDDLELNEIFHFVKQLFGDSSKFHDISQQITRHLFDVSSHPKIKGGEVYITLFDNVQIEGEVLQAIGVFKSETKETYLKVYPDGDGFSVAYEQEAINIQKLDKGCLIFNTEEEQGYKVVVIDQTNKSAGDAAVYWKDDFLKLKVRNDQFNQTTNYLNLYKGFIEEKIDEEFEISKPDKIDLLNRSMKYFKEKDTFDFEEFSEEVIGNEVAASSFKEMIQTYESEFDVEIGDTFEISQQAVKKQNSNYKSVLKLDKNFSVYIHGDRKLLENDFDEEKGMSYYKLYYKEEK